MSDPTSPPTPAADAARHPPAADTAALLSALTDGEADPAAAQRATAAWAADPAARAAWHCYHLIGDVLRSADMATAPARDADMLAALRARLADEPRVLAPQAQAPAPPRTQPPPQPTTAQRRQRTWLPPLAVAAGFVAVAGVLVVLRLLQPAAALPAAPVLVAAPPAAPVLAAADAPGAVSVLGGANTVVNNNGMLRDAQLDTYLRAHRAALGATPVAMPGGALRQVDTAGPAR